MKKLRVYENFKVNFVFKVIMVILFSKFCVLILWFIEDISIFNI